ncbi:DUF4405 domain-containing protein [Pseudomonas knackmussii]|uniref:DUF4405 domain-containing protein n=1 Tax=Pseudomonas knackmussii TaxID=65741 RepID=UPI001363BDF6|nr:DUF4405 domain-containing protein [Pseudomonas knackmussii]
MPSAAVTNAIHRYATPLTTGLFAVSTVSGIALFFHWAPGAFHGMHEWLSIALLLPFALHVWKNWSGLVGYLRRKTLLLPLLASAVAAVLFVLPAGGAGGRGGNPAFAAIQVLSQARLVEVAPLYHMTTDELLGKLRARGLEVNDASQTLAEVAATGSQQPAQLISELGRDGRH